MVLCATTGGLLLSCTAEETAVPEFDVAADAPVVAVCIVVRGESRRRRDSSAHFRRTCEGWLIVRTPRQKSSHGLRTTCTNCNGRHPRPPYDGREGGGGTHLLLALVI